MGEIMTSEDHKHDEILNLLHRRNEAAACLAERMKNEHRVSCRTQGRHLSRPPRRAMYMLALLCKPQVYRRELSSRKWLRKMKSIRFL